MTLSATAEQLPLVKVYRIVSTPADKACTMPDVVTVASAVLLLLQVPPAVVSDKETVVLAQRVDGPVMAATEGP